MLYVCSVGSMVKCMINESSTSALTTSAGRPSESRARRASGFFFVSPYAKLRVSRERNTGLNLYVATYARVLIGASYSLKLFTLPSTIEDVRMYVLRTCSVF